MIYNKRNSYIIAIASIVFSLFGIVIFVIEPTPDPNFLEGIGLGALIILGIGILSHRKSKRGFSKKDMDNIVKTKHSLKHFFLYAGLGIILASFLRKVDSPFLIGFPIGIALATGLMVLIDNLWLKSIFLWNSKDEKARKIWLQK